MNLLSFLTLPSIYHYCSTRKMFWEGNFKPVNMKHFGHRNVRKHRNIKEGEKYTTLGISLDYGSLENMKIKYSEPKFNLGGSGKKLITSMGLNNIKRSKRKKNPRCVITNVSLKDISKIIREFGKLCYEVYVQNRSKHEPTDSYFCLVRQVAKCMMRLN